jgi:hypothetical protein
METRFKIIAQPRGSTMITNFARKWPFVGYPIGKSEPLSERDKLAARKVRVNPTLHQLNAAKVRQQVIDSQCETP